MKLTTKKLKEMMSKWLSNFDMKSITSIREITGTFDDEELNQKHIDCAAKQFGLGTGFTKEFVEDHIWKTWSAVDSWSRVKKYLLREDAFDYFYANGCFAIDLYGDANKQLVTKFFNSPELAQKCICRVFVPKNDSLRDNYRLEVITTPEDDEVVGWSLFVD